MSESASVPIPFAVGEVLWWPGSSPRQEQVTCPICFGKRVATVVLGDGSEWEIECSACGLGFDSPRGFQMEWVHEFKPTRFYTSSVEVRGEEVHYHAADRHYADAKDLYRTEEECAARCAEKNKDAAAERERRGTYIVGQIKEKFAWSLHYWRRQRGDYTKRIEWIDRRIRLIKDKKMHLKVNAEPSK